MPTYKTPNVYVEEVSTLPPSVVPVATAVPAFIGCTEKAGSNQAYLNQPIRISSMLDYTTLFGGAYATEFTVTLNASELITEITAADGSAVTPDYLMYYTLRAFFDNGGGPCYVVSIGDYSDKPSKEQFLEGLAALRKEDEPTLILLTDAVNLASNTDYYDLCQSALKQCNDLKDRFAILDVLASDRTVNGIGASFRQGIGTENLKYGAAYYPYLQTSLNYHYTDDSVTINGLSDSGAATPSSVGEYSTGENGLLVTYNGPQSDDPRVRITVTDRQSIAVEVVDRGLVIRLPNGGATVAEILAAATEVENYRLAVSGAGSATIDSPLDETSLTYSTISGGETSARLSDAMVKTEKTELYNTLKTALNAMRVVLPSSGAVAGVYAKVDRERGVWKAPANVSLASVIGPTVKVTNEEQENLNVDSTAGKSINAIRSFIGKGTLIWGARTLAGNDNEWRYVPVRRLFNLIEESIQKATNFVVFEANNAITWLKVKTIAETYLDGLWRQGALAGSSQEEAYFVSVGLGQTMTEQDILEGRMIVEIGVSAVRPAEFIILRFSHKLQQA
ncbi:MAG: phage tail sheath subtilisin-like domain-containing protein [Leptolyngbyaceae cyanobacterium MO_188.B28]|nr:phage tail sheath subtilisin-like domain-containing protein [Leptolyngbyaceae cyanobacterium MO_188.B28]